MFLKPLMLVAAFAAATAASAQGRDPDGSPHARFFPDENDMECMINRADGLASNKATPSDELARQIVEDCHRQDRDWLRCTSMDAYCQKYEYYALIPYLRVLIKN